MKIGARDEVLNRYIMFYNNNNIMCIIILRIIDADNIRIRDTAHKKYTQV